MPAAGAQSNFFVMMSPRTADATSRTARKREKRLTIVPPPKTETSMGCARREPGSGDARLSREDEGKEDELSICLSRLPSSVYRLPSTPPTAAVLTPD